MTTEWLSDSDLRDLLQPFESAQERVLSTLFSSPVLSDDAKRAMERVLRASHLRLQSEQTGARLMRELLCSDAHALFVFDDYIALAS